MVTVVFHLTDWVAYPGTDNPQSLMHTWLHNCAGLGVDKLVMIDTTTYKLGKYYKHTITDIDFELVDDLALYLQDKTEDVIFFELVNNSTCLSNFTHPTNAIYVVGPNHSSLSIYPNITPNHWVKVPSNVNYPLYDQSVVTIAMYDRIVKNK